MSGRKDGPGGRRRYEAVLLVLALALIASQSIGVIGAAASGDSRGRDRSGSFSSDTTKVQKSAPSVAKAPPSGNQSSSNTMATARPAAQPTDSTSLNVDLDQWANLPNQGWQNGDLNKNNSAYHEGEVVPFRLAIEGLTAGQHTIHINYDFTAGGHEAYDFLATWNATENPGLCASGGGAVSSMCPNLPQADTKTFPSDPFQPGAPTKAGLSVAGAEAASGVGRDLTLYGGTINNITGPTHSGPVSGNSSGDFTVTFTTSASAALFAWGGHLAESAYWITTSDGPNGAAQVSGAPWHMRTQQLDGSGNKNQDRSIQPSAIVALPGLTVDKTADSGTVQVGDPIGYSITVTNTGNVPLTNVALQDPLPGGSSIDWSVAGTSGNTTNLNCSISGSPPSETLSCTKDSLPAGAGFTVHVTSPTSGAACGTYDNVASASADGVASVDSPTASIVVEGCAPDLTIAKAASSGSVQYGNAFSYTVTVKNTGNAQATNVVVTDNLDDALTGVSASYDVDPGSNGGTGSCSVASGTNVVSCDIGTLAANDGQANGPDEVVVTIDVTAPATCGAIANTAHVSSDQDATGSDSNQVSVDVTGCAPDLTITKSASAGSVGPSGTFDWTITVVNAGNAPAGDVVVTDDVPDSVAVVSASYDVDPGSAGGTGNCSVGAGNAVTCDIGTLAVNDGQANGADTVQVTISVTAPEACGPLENSAQVQMGTEAPISSNTSTVNVEGCAPSLSISKSASSGSVDFGQPFSYTITVKNTGNDQATGVIVTDDLDDSLTGVSASFDVDPGSAGGTGSCTVGSGNTVSCPVGTLAKDDGAADGPDEVVVTIGATAPSTCGAILNTAHVSSDQNADGADSNQVSVDITGCVPGLDFSKSGPASVAQGGTVTYHVSVSNNGNAASDPVTVTDSVPLANVQASFSLNGGQAQPCDVNGGSVSCDLGSLQPGDSVDITITGTAPSDNTCPTLHNTATVQVGESSSDTNTVDTVVTGCTTPTPPPPPPVGIQIIKGGPALAHVGDTITYTFDVSLTTSTPLSNITVTDPICNAAPVLGSKSGGDTDDVLEPGEVWHYTCTHLVTASDPDPLPNTATVTGTSSDGRTASDQDSHLVDIIHPAIQIVKTADPTSGEPGDTITYTYVVTNTGDVTLYDISVDDDVIGHICDIASLDPGESATCTAEYVIPEQTGAIVNVGTAVGSDETGKKVKDDDKAKVDVVLGTVVTKTPPSGTAFTGASDIVPLAGLALLFLLAGTGTLFLSRRRKGDAQA